MEYVPILEYVPQWLHHARAHDPSRDHHPPSSCKLSHLKFLGFHVSVCVCVCVRARAVKEIPIFEPTTSCLHGH